MSFPRCCPLSTPALGFAAARVAVEDASPNLSVLLSALCHFTSTYLKTKDVHSLSASYDTSVHKDILTAYFAALATIEHRLESSEVPRHPRQLSLQPPPIPKRPLTHFLVVKAPMRSTLTSCSRCMTYTNPTLPLLSSPHATFSFLSQARPTLMGSHSFHTASIYSPGSMAVLHDLPLNTSHPFRSPSRS